MTGHTPATKKSHGICPHRDRVWRPVPTPKGGSCAACLHERQVCLARPLAAGRAARPRRHSTKERAVGCPHRWQLHSTPSPVAAAQHTSSPVAAAQHTPSPVAAAQHTPSPVAAAQHTSSPVAAAQHTSSPVAAAQHAHKRQVVHTAAHQHQLACAKDWEARRCGSAAGAMAAMEDEGRRRGRRRPRVRPCKWRQCSIWVPSLWGPPL